MYADESDSRSIQRLNARIHEYRKRLRYNLRIAKSSCLLFDRRFRCLINAQILHAYLALMITLRQGGELGTMLRAMHQLAKITIVTVDGDGDGDGDATRLSVRNNKKWWCRAIRERFSPIRCPPCFYRRQVTIVYIHDAVLPTRTLPLKTCVGK